MSQLHDLMNPVPIKNRCPDHPVSVHYAGEMWTWKPGETKYLAQRLADWMEKHSLFAWQPADQSLNVPAVFKTRLVVLGRGADESDIPYAATLRKENIDREALGPILDPENNQPFETRYIDVRGVPVRSMAPVDAKERVEREQRSATIESEGTERLAALAAEAVPAGE